MKKLLLCAILMPLLASAQSDTSKIEQYCSVNVFPRLLSNKVTVDVDFGEVKSVWRDSRIKDEAGKLVKFNSYIDAMNYMGRQGWKLVNSLVINSNNTTYYSYLFRKEFAKSEVD
jgi:hypothetical protein